jgi:hypothetical protein
MNVLYLMKQRADETLGKIMDVQRKKHQVAVVELGKNRDYEHIIGLIVSCDKVISW